MRFDEFGDELYIWYLEFFTSQLMFVCLHKLSNVSLIRFHIYQKLEFLHIDSDCYANSETLENCIGFMRVELYDYFVNTGQIQWVLRGCTALVS
jgi:hypothetical protein